MPVADKRPVTIAPRDPETAGLWDDLGRLVAQVLPADWTLVGGLMVQLHAYEAGEMGVRVTTDIDILGDARKQKAIEKIARALDDDGFELEPPSPTDGVSHRWRRGELIVDLLAPDGLRGDPPMLGVSARSRFRAAVRRSCEPRRWRWRSMARSFMCGVRRCLVPC